MVRYTVLVISLLFSTISIIAQDTLPEFSVVNRDNRIFLSWKNNYPVVKQINIQRSLDSTRNFTTILSVPDPTIPQNGFVDTRPMTNTMFYRLFILLDSGQYVFTRSRRPETSAILPSDGPSDGSNGERVVVADDLTANEIRDIKEKLTKPAPAPEKNFIILRNDSVIASISERNFQRFRDSVVQRTRDTLVFSSVDSILIKTFVPKVVYKPSEFVYTEPDGNIAIKLEDAPVKQYRIRFFDEDKRELFEVKKIRERFLTLDKSNFLHAGWFFFELYDEDKLIEKHKFYIPKD